MEENFEREGFEFFLYFFLSLLLKKCGFGCLLIDNMCEKMVLFFIKGVLDEDDCFLFVLIKNKKKLFLFGNFLV